MKNGYKINWTPNTLKELAQTFELFGKRIYNLLKIDWIFTS